MLCPAGEDQLGGPPTQPLWTPVCQEGSVLISPKHRGSGQRNQMSSAGCPSGQLVKWASVAFLRGSLESLLEASSHRPEPRKRVHGKTLEGNPLTNSRTGVGAACVLSHPLGLCTPGPLGLRAQWALRLPAPWHPLQPGRAPCPPLPPEPIFPELEGRGGSLLVLGSDLSIT